MLFREFSLYFMVVLLCRKLKSEKIKDVFNKSDTVLVLLSVGLEFDRQIVIMRPANNGHMLY